MNLAQSLHMAARRYCIEQHAYWGARYAELPREAVIWATRRHALTPRPWGLTSVEKIPVGNVGTANGPRRRSDGQSRSRSGCGATAAS